MKGIFIRKNFNGWLLLQLLCGLSFIGMYIFFNVIDTTKNANVTLIFLVIGILMCLTVISLWLLNYGAFFNVSEEFIQAKYHWFGKINCNLTDVDFALARVNTLIIQLKNGKVYTIGGIQNSWELCSFIRQNMNFDANVQPSKLIEELNELKSTRKKWFIYTCFALALMFINIFVTVFLTGERDFNEFSKTDWKIMTVMGAVECVTVIMTFWLALKTGKNNTPIERLNYYIPRTIIETKPLLPGNMLKVYTDRDYMERLTLFGFPNEDSVYYSVERIDGNYNLEKIFTSEIYEDIDHMPDGLEWLIDITERVL